MDFTHYKRSTIQPTVERRLALHHLKGLAEYANLLHQDPAEMKALSRDFLINVTGFFRGHPESFTALTETSSRRSWSIPPPRRLGIGARLCNW